ncbi:MAG: serine/threonine protein kinase [Myxococcales bacterium]|nr:serine/threonine protein kinase [Myxococcales bacterium]
MAEVFAGRALGSLGFQKPVAIKRLLPSLAQDEEFVGRLVDEAKLLVGLSHANVISVLDLVRESDDVFLVMEFVDGPSLRQLLGAHAGAGRGPLPLSLVTYVIQAACAGLEYAHGRPTGAIIHADISPSNLLLTTTGEVKVADFGIARREGIATAVEGKWAYMPPEQAAGAALTNRSDEFALGVCLYELLTGVHPFARRVTEHGRDEAALRQVRRPRELRPEIPAELEAACLRAMSADPAHRFPRVQQLHDALSEVRFASGWRDGASELAALIGELNGMSRPAPPDAMQLVAMAAAGRTQVTAQPVTIITRSLIGGLETDPQLAALAAEANALAATTPHAWTINRKQAHRRRSWAVAAAILGGAIVAGMVAAIVIAQAGDHGVDPALAAPVAAAPAPGPAPPVVEVAPSDDVPAPRAAPEVAAEVADAALAPSVAAAEVADVADEVVMAPPPSPTRPAPGRPTASRPRAPRAEPREPREPAVAAAGVGTVSVHAVPWAYVTVDGTRHVTPTTLRLAPGSYNLVFENPKLGAKITRFVTVRPGANRPVRVSLKP